ncbi:MAG TPA: hypothetical protein VEA18_01905 [Candidatus Kapabacteria bacterium]|nr:hypothetical protein [Candidatus Kapabacteria bacterium]
MIADLLHLHVRERLKHIHLSGVCIMITFFILLFYLAQETGLPMLYPELLLLGMAVLITLSYISLLSPHEKEPATPLLVFFLLNVCTTGLVWLTGVLHSPFIILYVILIIITSQLYHYRFGLVQTLLAFGGFVAVFGATTHRILPYYSLLPNTDVSILLQPPSVIFVYGLLYATLFLFTVLSSSNARTLLFRPMRKFDIDSTYQEKIIHDMPLGVLIVDEHLTILGNNPVAASQFPTKIPSKLDEHIHLHGDIKRSLDHLAKTGKGKDITWQMDTGKKVPVHMSVTMMKGKKKGSSSYIVFVQ